MKKAEPEKGWASVRQISDVLGISVQGISQSYLPMLETKDVDESGRPTLLRCKAVLDIYVSRRADQFLEPLQDGGDSPALERYRLAKAKLAELDLHLRKNDLIERDKAKEIFLRWAVLVRRMGERLSKRFGPDAAATVNETLDACRIAVSGICVDETTPVAKKEKS